MNLSPFAPVFGEQFGRELLPAVIAYDKASIKFLDRPRWWEAAFCHGDHGDGGDD
jgi:hypothetical protein